VTKPFLGSGSVVSLFSFTRSGLSYFKRNRLQSLMLGIIRAAWQSTKAFVADYIDTYWPRDTSAMIASAKKWLSRYAVYDLDNIPNLLIGSDVDYAAWVYSMAERMQARGKSVNWTNKNTEKIEDDILGHTVDYARDVFRRMIDRYLDEYNLGWMFGRGRPPKKTTIEYESDGTRKAYTRTIPRFRGKHKPITVYG